MDKRFWGVLAAIAVIFVGIIVISGRNKASAPDSASNSASLSNHVEGTSPKKVTLVEYGDFECPVCYGYYPVVKQVADKYKDQVVFQFRNFPLTQAHPNAFAGARAAEAASMQGKFWQMHDQLYENQDPSGQSGWVASNDPLNQYFIKFAASAGIVNIDQFKKDYASDQVNKTINADMAEGNRLKVNGTPSFFLNGTFVENTQLTDSTNRPQLDKFSKLLDDALNAKK